MAECDEDDVVPVGERIRLDDHPVADHALDREAPAIDERRDALDHGATTPVPDDGFDVGQRSAADRVLLGVVAEIAAVAGPRKNVGWMLRNRRRVARSVSNLGGPAGSEEPRTLRDPGLWCRQPPRTDKGNAVGGTATECV